MSKQGGAQEEIQFETSEGVKVVNSFDDMGLKEDLVRGIYAYSKRNIFSKLTANGIDFEKPSAIQQRAIGPIIKGRGTALVHGTSQTCLAPQLSCLEFYVFIDTGK